MPTYLVRVGRMITDYQIAHLNVEAVSEAEAMTIAQDKAIAEEYDLDWSSKESYSTEGGEIEAEAVYIENDGDWILS